MTPASRIAIGRIAVGPALLGLAWACAHKADDCHELLTCGDYDAATSSTGQGGTAGLSSPSGGVGSGGGPTAGSGAGGAPNTGGSGTGGITSACNPTCTGAKPVCNEPTKTCVECLTNGNCATSARAACDPETNTCVGCTADTYCSAPSPACDLDNNVCVTCTKDAYCPTNTPKCKLGDAADAGTTTSTCVECLSDNDCSGAKPGCNLASNTCVPCTKNEHCPSTAPLCDTAKNTCVECLSSADCKSALASTCIAAQCEPCSSNADCSHIAGKGVCKTSTASDADAGADASTDAGASDGECVQCTGTQYSACGQSNGKSLICNSLTNTCSTTATAQSSGLCQPCVSDAQCTPGKLCYLETFGGNDVGHFCFWKQGDTANGAPATCFTSTNRPYMKVESNVTSIDGETATLCTLRASTCTAYNQFSNIDCAPSGTPQDALCGFAPGADSKCVETTSGSGAYRCTTVCLSNDDCKTALTCNTGASPNICNFQ